MSKLNIFNKSWVDMVFEGRNKEYGAYKLRTENPKTTVKSLIIGAVLFTFLVATPKIVEKLGDIASKIKKKMLIRLSR